MAARHYLKRTNTTNNDVVIPSFFDIEEWVCGKTYDIKVSHVYSPSVLWIVLKHREFNYFFMAMNKFYNKNYTELKVNEKSIQKGLYCVAYTDGAFYRAQVKQISFRNIQVFLFDFGYTISVTKENIFQLKESMKKLPMQCVRANLWNIQPKNKENWEQKELNRVLELVGNTNTVAIVNQVNKDLKLLHIRIGLCENLTVTDLSDKLIQESLVISIKDKNVYERNEKTRYTLLVRNRYFYPGHYELENSLVPNSLALSEKLSQYVPLDKLYPNLYKLQYHNNLNGNNNA